MSDSLTAFCYSTEGDEDEPVVALFGTEEAAESFAVSFIYKRWGDAMGPHLHKHNELNRLISNSMTLSIYEEVFEELYIREGWWFQAVPVDPDFAAFKHPLL